MIPRSKRLRLVRSLFCFLALFSAPACDRGPQEYFEYEHADGFRVELPSDWNLHEPSERSAVAVFAPQKHLWDGFLENIFLTRVEGTGGLDIRDFAKIDRERTVGALEEAEILLSADVELAGYVGHRLVFTHLAEAGRIQYDGRAIIVGNTLYKLSYSAAVNAYDEYLPLFEHACDSFAPGIADTVRHVHGAAGFSIAFPGDWHVVEDYEATDFFAREPPRASHAEETRLVASVLVEPIDGDVSLGEKTVARLHRDLVDRYGSVESLGHRELELEGRPALRVAERVGQDGRRVVIYVVDSPIGMVLVSFTASDRSFKRHVPVIQEIFESFRVEG